MLFHPPFLTSIVFALAGFINAVSRRKFDDIAIMPTFILTSSDVSWWRVLLRQTCSPSHGMRFRCAIRSCTWLTHSVSACSASADISLGVAYAVMFGFAVVLAAIAIQLLNRGIGLRS